MRTRKISLFYDRAMMESLCHVCVGPCSVRPGFGRIEAFIDSKILSLKHDDSGIVLLDAAISGESPEGIAEQ